MRDIFVICRSRKEFNNLVAMSGKPWEYEVKHKMVHYVENIEQLRGLKPCRVILYGIYHKRPDWPAMKGELQTLGHRLLLIR